MENLGHNTFHRDRLRRSCNVGCGGRLCLGCCDFGRWHLGRHSLRRHGTSAVTLIYKSWIVVQNTSYIRMGSLPLGSLPNAQLAKCIFCQIQCHYVTQAYVMYKMYIMGFYYIRIVLFRVFPDLESALKIARKCGKIRKKSRKNIFDWHTIQGPTSWFSGSTVHFQIQKLRLCQVKKQ